MEALRYYYRKLFHLSAKELEEEPIDQFFTNLRIYGYIQKGKQRQMKRAEKRGRT